MLLIKISVEGQNFHQSQYTTVCCKATRRPWLKDGYRLVKLLLINYHFVFLHAVQTLIPLTSTTLTTTKKTTTPSISESSSPSSQKSTVDWIFTSAALTLVLYISINNITFITENVP